MTVPNLIQVTSIEAARRVSKYTGFINIFFSVRCPAKMAWPIFMIYASNNVVLVNELLLAKL
jgi:hypothetical protein